MKRYFFTGFFFILFSSMYMFAQSPWEQHGSIEISKNGRTLQYTDGTPFLWIGDTGWGMFQQLTREEVDYYLDHRQKLGFTVIQSVVFWYTHGGGIESGPHNAANAYGHRPFRGEADAPDTSEPLIIAGGSPEAPNDYWDQVYQIMLGDYRLSNPVKPTLFLEGSYEYGSYGHECGWITPLKVRRQIYHTFFAGGAGHTYGAGPVWAMRGTGGAYNCGYTWKQALEFPGAANFAGICKSFLEENTWSGWIPGMGIVRRGSGDGENLKVAVTDLSGQQILVYYSNNTDAEISNTMNKAARAQWFDPRNGDFRQAGIFKPGEGRDMLPPSGWEDAILVLSASD